METSSTVLETSRDCFEGSLVKLYPYWRGAIRRTILIELWAIMEETNGGDIVFYSGQHPETPVARRGDPTEFIQYFSDEKRSLLIIQDKASEQIAGFTWFDDFIPDYRCMCGLFFRKNYRGKIAEEGAKLSIRYAHDILRVRDIWGFTPWVHARKFAEKIGMEWITTLPGLFKINDKPADIYVTKISKEK